MADNTLSTDTALEPGTIRTSDNHVLPQQALQFVRRQIVKTLNFSTFIIDHRLTLNGDDTWEKLFENIRRENDGNCIVRIQVGIDVFYSDFMPVTQLTYTNLKPIIDRFRWGELYNYNEQLVSITYLIFDQREQVQPEPVFLWNKTNKNGAESVQQPVNPIANIEATVISLPKPIEDKDVEETGK